MTLPRRVRALEAVVQPRRHTKALPDDPVAFARALLAGAFDADDIDPAHPHHAGWLALACAFLGTIAPEHQNWLRAERERNPLAYPSAILMPAPNDVIRAAGRGRAPRLTDAPETNMRLNTRLQKLEGKAPRCDRVLRLAPERYVPSEADPCPRCGGCHVLVIEEQVVEAGPDGELRVVE